MTDFRFLRFLFGTSIFILPMWPSYIAFKLDPLPRFDLARIIMLGLFISWAVVFVFSSKFRGIVKKHFLMVGRFALFLLFFTFSWKLIASLGNPEGMHSVFSAMRDIAFFLFPYFVALSLWRGGRDIQKVAAILAFASIFIGGFVFVESILQHNFFYDLAKRINPSIADSLEPLVRDGFYRASGPFPQPLALASYCVTTLPLIFWLAIEGRGGGKIIGWTGVLCLLFSIWATDSRAGLAILVFMLCGQVILGVWDSVNNMTGFEKMGARLLLVPILLLTLSGALGVGAYMAQGRTEHEAGSSEIRLLQLSLGVPLVLNRPVMGYGPGQAADVLGLKAKTVDNYYLTLALESGVPETVGFLLILLFFIHRAWRLYKCSSSPYVRRVAIALFWSMNANLIFLSVLSLEQAIPFLFLSFAATTALEWNHERRWFIA